MDNHDALKYLRSEEGKARAAKYSGGFGAQMSGEQLREAITKLLQKNPEDGIPWGHAMDNGQAADSSLLNHVNVVQSLIGKLKDEGRGGEECTEEEVEVIRIGFTMFMSDELRILRELAEQRVAAGGHPLEKVAADGSVFLGYEDDTKDPVFATGIGNCPALIGTHFLKMRKAPPPMLALACKRFALFMDTSTPNIVEDGQYTAAMHFERMGLFGKVLWELLERKVVSTMLMQAVLKYAGIAWSSGTGWEGALGRVLTGLSEVGPSTRWRELFGYYWACSGFPRVRLDHKMAAMLKFTGLPTDLDEGDYQPPWNAFVLEVPPGVIAARMGDGLDWVTHVAMNRVPHTNRTMTGFAIITEKGKSFEHILDDDQHLTELVTTPQKLLRESVIKYGMNQDDFASVIRESATLLTGAIIRMNSVGDGARLEETKRKKKGALKSKFSTHFEMKEYVLSDDITVDLRQVARETAEEGREVDWKARWIVRGHYRNQAVGHGRKDRRRTWVRPHWRGPKEAPIAMRDHVIGERT